MNVEFTDVSWDFFVTDVMRLWDANNDTLAMSRLLRVPEHVCEMALHVGRERRREAA